MKTSFGNMFSDIHNVELEQLMSDFLRLQVNVSFKKHKGFMMTHGLDTSKRVLDVGTGNGYFCGKLAQLSPHMQFIGIDFKKEMIDEAMKTQATQGLSNVQWLHEDITNLSPQFLSKKKEYFDGVIFRFVLVHIKEVESVLKTTRQLLKPNGMVWFFSIELDYMNSEPQYPEFELYKRATEKLYRTFGINGHLGGRLPAMLKKAGYRDIYLEKDSMSKEEIGLENYQRFMLSEAALFHRYAPNSITKKELEVLTRFATEIVPKPHYHATYGNVMISARQ